MISNELLTLTITAASIGFFHTLLGPDHYLPFILLGRARSWSLFKTGWITVLCGLGHILSSVVLGIIGIFFGIAISKLEALESLRANIACWALITFGLLYFVWGLRRAFRNRSHKHPHIHSADKIHLVRHESDSNITPWILFIIFVFGPCEPLIPLLMYPAAKSNLFGLVSVTVIFGTVTILTMLSIVLVGSLGINFLPLKRFERYAHALAGLLIFLSGLTVQFLGL